MQFGHRNLFGWSRPVSIWLAALLGCLHRVALTSGSSLLWHISLLDVGPVFLSFLYRPKYQSLAASVGVVDHVVAHNSLFEVSDRQKAPSKLSK
jgi:hypothetical protein